MIIHLVSDLHLEFGYQELPWRVIEELVGLPINHFLQDIGLSQAQEEEIILKFREVLKIEIMRNNLVFPGVKKFLINILIHYFVSYLFHHE